MTVNVLFPSQGEVQTDRDAVVSLAPQVHRLATAERLMDAGHADTLVISYFEGDVSGRDADGTYAEIPVSEYCESDQRGENVCFTPEEIATIGEAFAVRDIAQANSWDALTVVTSKAHAFRAHHIFERCLGQEIDVNLVYADPDLNVAQWGWRVVYENAAFVKAIWQTSTRC